MTRAFLKGLFKRKNLLRAAGGLAAAWLLAWYAVPWLFPLPEGLLHPEERGALVLDRDGARIATLPGPDYYHTEPVRLQEVPDMLLKATLAAEDKRFFSHGGADFLALARAVAANAAGGEVVSGASTITQQLAKNANPPVPRSLPAKAREFFQARRMEMSMSKKAILESYFNRLDYGNLRRGPAAAARFYFGREMSRLSLAECALLAGLPQGPSFLNPLRHPERALQRRNLVLRRMREEGWATDGMVDRALLEPLFSAGAEEDRRPLAPHVTAALMHAGRTGEVRTTLDASLQRGALEIVKRELERLKGHHVTQAAVVVAENATGNILCLVGSADRNHPAGGLLDGTTLRRSPGSALKPFVYAQAFVLGAYPGTVLPDVPTTYRSAHGLEAPQNYNRAYMGPISIRQALACSQNIPAMRALGTFGGAARLLKLLNNLGIRGIQGDASHYGLGLAIGNAEVSLRELTGAYECLARGGGFLPLKLEQGPSVPERPVLPPEACFLTADILADREARLAAFSDAEVMNLPFRYACKTGTSSDFRDNWCIGFTREITVGVWVGNFDASPMKQVGGMAGAAPIFAGVMKLAHRSLPPSFPRAVPGMVRIRIDARTGRREGALRVPQAHAREEWASPETMPQEVTAGDYDAAGRAFLDSRYTEWFTSPSCTARDAYCLLPGTWSGEAPRILVPADGSRLVLDPEMPGTGRRLKLRSNLPAGAVWSSPTLTIVQYGDEATALLEPGAHVITVRHPELNLEQRVSVTVREL